MITEKEILHILKKEHISDVQSVIYARNKRNVINASDVIHVIQLLDMMGYELCEK